MSGEDMYLEVVRLEARQAARAEVASLCGLMLRRLQEDGPLLRDVMESAFAEALRDFSGTTQEPGSQS
jgi:hypothetical protein